ncbi:MAG TPA: AsmA family protein, partial [Salinimicrobium sp.]|nr:AsmA family protein [Salinimicrobium sp.]
MKKILKITGIVVGVLVLLLFLAPFLFEKQLKGIVVNSINDKLNARVAFADMDVSLLRNFPDATLSIDELLITNNAPFEGDTLAVGQEVVLEMSVFELFNSAGEPMKVDALAINNAGVYLKIDSLGNANYDIVKPSNTTASDTSSGGGFQFDVEHYEINNSEVTYFDEGADIGLIVSELDHEGTGDFSAAESTLNTFSSALVSLVVDSTKYLDRNKVRLDADFMMNLEEMKFTFLENEAMINQLPLTFEGYVKVNEDNNEVDLAFRTPSSSFKNFLAVIPQEYSKNIEEVNTSGDFIVQGTIKGIVDETFIPKFNIDINSENASFKYPDLPKGVEDITIAAEVVNNTGLAEDTYIELEKLNFRIDQDVFRAEGSIRNLMGNPVVDMAINGTIDLTSIEKAYPLDLEQDLNGIVTANLRTSFDMNSIETEQYQNVNSSGTATIRDFSY